MKCLKNLSPQPLWNYFEEICQIPRPSKKEEKIIGFLLDFAAKNNLIARLDDVGNVLISKPGTAGRENDQVVILQSHLDMVCEKNSETIHDFEVDSIKAYIDEGWVRAQGTTLGSDDGIGIAAQMAVLTSTNLSHGPIECLFTVDEETGLSGAFALQPGFLSGTVLLNLDSEDEGELFIGCAGGIDTVGTLKYSPEDLPVGSYAMKLEIKGLLGGHSGDDINKNRGNAIKILNRFLMDADRKFDMHLADLKGGNLRNAIAREAFAVVVVPQSQKESLVVEWNVFTSEMEFEFERSEPKLMMHHQSVELPEFVIDSDTKTRLLHLIAACPHGVLEMSSRMAGMVETSTNLASVKFSGKNEIMLVTSQRSEIDSRKLMAAEMVASVMFLGGATIEHSEGYPGWTPNPDSVVAKIAADSYKKLFGNDPVVKSIHAGLECGLFLEKYPELDMVSFGPTIRGAHSPDERISIETVDKFWKLLVEVLENIR
ncbi:aminoacyl-histidine dipeptidase [Aquipluma nitroreducens]|uniref:Cytosol non-specific dipeptidase n=1 Tax=Aquipluma nitroreducens TaxID=2010828 RepID=A0A5K7S5Y0_9BACT|nr:aminoacyl-histidine dipeptidase [Aquipluma nitroreducens]BBE16754.1 aminoacyl-histidine dipeptidase [Aquipluma nitroreducens]